MVKFINPEFLIALAVLLVPLIIHFFQFKRYKTVFFSQVGFLKAVQQDTKKKSELKKLLILISRLCMLACLVLAFSRPYLPSHNQENNSQHKSAAIYLDNSFSMNREGSEGSLLEQAKRKTISIANAFEPGTSFILFTNDASAKDLLPLNREQLLQRLTGVKESAKSLKTSETIKLINNAFSHQDNELQRNVYLLSDFQEHQFDRQAVEWDSLTNYYLIHFSSNLGNNLLIDSCWFETPGRRAGQQETLFARIKNQADQTVQKQAVRLTINDSLKAIADLQLEPGEEKTIELKYRNSSSGFQLGKVQLDDYPVVYDNTYYFSYQVQSKVKVLAIYNPEEKGIIPIEALLNNDPFFEFEKTENRKVQTSPVESAGFVILVNTNNLGSGLAKTLSDFIKKGGSVAVLPGQNINAKEFNLFYSQCNASQVIRLDTTDLKMSVLNYNHPVFKDVFEQQEKDLELPVIKSSYRYQSNLFPGQESIIEFANGNPAISDFRIEKGHLYNFNFPTGSENSDFLEEAIFVPLIYNMALNSLDPQIICQPIEKQMVTEIRKSPNDTPPFELQKTAADETFRVPVLSESANFARLDFSQLIDQAGFYSLLINGKITKKLAFNYDRSESLKNGLTMTELSKRLKTMKQKNIDLLDSEVSDFETQINQLNEGIELWFWLVVLALLFIAIESAIIRWMK